jgi:hypothetical protein
MADFVVRFIPEDMKPADFRALCTIAGGERINDINELAPIVPEEAANELKSTPSPATPAPVASSAPEASPTPTPAAPPVVAKITLPPGWNDVVDEAAGFAVAMPAGTAVTPSVPDFPSALTSKAIGVTGKDNASFTVWQFQFQRDVPATELPRVFETVRTRMLRDSKVSAERPLDLEGNKAIEWIAESREAGKTGTRCYVVKNRVYVLNAGGPKADWKDVVFFLDSFRLVKK